MKYLQDSRLTQLTSDLTGAVLNTRGCGNGGAGGGSSSSSVGASVRVGNPGRGGWADVKKGKGRKQRRQAAASSAGGGGGGNNNATTTTTTTTTTMPSYYAYNPVGYSTYNGDGGGRGGGGHGTTHHPTSSCRVIYGRVEAYTTKRAGSDKKTAYAVGERYAHEMERLNEAVEALKRRRRHHALGHQRGGGGGGRDEGNDDDDDDGGATGGGGPSSSGGGGGGEKKDDEVVSTTTRRPPPPRGRSCSVDGHHHHHHHRAAGDGVTFATSFVPPPRLSSLLEGGAAVVVDKDMRDGEEEEEEGGAPPPGAAEPPLGGILKRPSSSSNNKRCRATSFDVSTGPSPATAEPASSSRRYRHSIESPVASFPSPAAAYHPRDYYQAIDDDPNTHPLIPQPSLYQSSLGEHHPGGEKKSAGPTMVPRRLMTDLILTLNASFPDYDFGDAQVSDFCTLSTPEAMRRINERLGEFAATTDAGADFLPRFWNTLDDVLFNGLRDCEVYSYSPQGCSGDDPLEFLTMSMANESGGAGVAAAGDAGVDVKYVAGPRGQTVMFNPVGDGGAIVSGDIILNDGLDASMLNHISPAGLSESTPHVTLWSMNYLFVSHNKKRIVLFACVQTMRTPQGNDDDDSGAEYGEYGENDIVFDEARREEEKESENASSGVDKSGKSTPIGDESVSVMVDDTDFEEGSVDVDDEVDRGDYDFDTGTMGISIGVPSQIA